jgi:nitrilase
MAQEPVRVAVVQAASVAFDLSATLQRVEVLAKEAAAGGARLVLFPEAFVSGYPRGMDFGAVIGERTTLGREWYRRYFESSIDLDGDSGRQLGSIARSVATDLVIGVIERVGSTLYCTVAFFGPDGRLLGRHRKLMPTASERLIWGFGDGSTMPVVDTAAGRVGAAICWENYMPLYRATLYSKGVQIWCAPTVDARDSWTPSMQHIAIEGRCFVLSANQFTRRSDYPADYESHHGDDPETILIRGGSCIVDPFGTLLAGPLFGREGILYADLDLDEIVRGKYDLDVVGHYARPDVFALMVDERAKPAVQRTGQVSSSDAASAPGVSSVHSPERVGVAEPPPPHATAPTR